MTGKPKARRPENHRELRFEIGSRILQLRRARRWTQQDLAQRLGVKVERISRLENGHSVPTVVELLRLSEIFGLDVDELARGQARKSPLRNTALLEAVHRLERTAPPEVLLAIGNCIDAIARMSEQVAGRAGQAPGEGGAGD
jgi:transcriptional regulator with XRE-family HTH domain